MAQPQSYSTLLCHGTTFGSHWCRRSRNSYNLNDHTSQFRQDSIGAKFLNCQRAQNLWKKLELIGSQHLLLGYGTNKTFDTQFANKFLKIERCLEFHIKKNKKRNAI